MLKKTSSPSPYPMDPVVLRYQLPWNDTQSIVIFSEKSHVTHFTLGVWIRTMVFNKSINIAVAGSRSEHTLFWISRQWSFLLVRPPKKPKGTTGGWQLVSMWLGTPMYKPWLYNHAYEPLTFCGMILQVRLLWHWGPKLVPLHCFALLGSSLTFWKVGKLGEGNGPYPRSMISMYT